MHVRSAKADEVQHKRQPLSNARNAAYKILTNFIALPFQQRNSLEIGCLLILVVSAWNRGIWL
jgi:hypothetical protein